MNREIIEAIKQIEREKGIDSETLLVALEDALLAAYRKTPGAVEWARVDIDRESGEMQVRQLVLPEGAELKTLPRPDSPEVERMRREARAMARVSHANLAQIHGAESWHGTPILILDEPSAALDPAAERLVIEGYRRAMAGRTTVVISHRLDVVRAADWVIDLGPGAGAEGGCIVAEGTPETVVGVPGSWTGQYLARLLDGAGA